MDYQKIISKISKKNYKFYFNSKNKFYDSYLKSRNTFLKKNFKEEIDIKTDNKKSISSTFKVLTQINKSNFNQCINKKIIIKLYKKFEVNNKIYSKYDINFSKKKSETELEIEAYILLNSLILKLEEINKLKKINVTLKLNDKILLNINKIKNYNYIGILKKNILFEINNLKKF